MGTPVPPSPPPPSRTNHTALAVGLGVLALFLIIVVGGIMVAVTMARHTQIVEHDGATGDDKTVDIHSPLGDLHVKGSDGEGKVEINSPFGSLKVNGEPDVARLGITVMPGATLSRDDQDSPFHDGVEVNGRQFHGTQVRLQSGNTALNVDVAEFRTAATPQQVLDYYQNQLASYGSVQRHSRPHGEIQLEVKLGDKNDRVMVVKPGADGTHFVLVRVAGDSAAN